MSRRGVILYGPPASGKDTVSVELSQHNPKFEQFRRLKAGSGRTAGYRLVTEAHLEQLSDDGKLLYTNARYGARYAVDRAGLEAIVSTKRVPVLHLGQVAGIEAVSAYPGIVWTVVLLWCSRKTTEARCRQRGNEDVSARLAVWDETLSDLATYEGSDWSLIVDTELHSVAETAALIESAVANPGDDVKLHMSLLDR